MPEYVYALHDFQPEHEDEISFRAGERIEVVEKDDLYGDGWWQGRNLAGQAGLFPQSYTQPAPLNDESASSSSTIKTNTPSTESGSRSALQPLKEEPETDSPPESTSIIAPQPQTQVSAFFLNQAETSDDQYNGIRHQRVVSTGSGEVMKATMTDVQQAIEQLGRGPNRDRDDRSFSFASSRGEQTETEEDYEMSDVDRVDPDAGESWHKGAREKLAAKARKAVEEAEKLDAIMNGTDSSRRAAPPIDVELSDDSGDEDGDYTTHSMKLPRRHPFILEEDEEPETSSPLQIENRPSQQETITDAATLPDTDPQTATAPQFSLPVHVDTPAFTAPDSKPTPRPYSPVTPVSADTSPAVTTFQEPKREYTPYRESMIALPSPTGSFPGATLAPPPDKSKYISVMSNYSVATTVSEMSPPLSSSEGTFGEEKEKQEKPHPSEWSVDEVLDWLKFKGFDQDVCDKFKEQEIAGDTLLELDVNLLKSEIGIMAFGKRMRIANAITDLRRPPSIVYSDHQSAQVRSPTQSHMIHPQHVSLTPSQSVSQVHTHSRSVSQSQSHHSFPGTTPSVQRNSLGSPTIGAYIPNGNSNGYGYGMMTPSESPATEYIVAEALVPESERQSSAGLGVGLPASFSNGRGPKGRPAQLMLSPSDSALKASAMAVSNIPEEDGEDRGHMSDGETGSTSMRHRLWRRSHDSTPNSRHSRDASPRAPNTPDKDAPKEKEKDKRNSGGKSGERLSIFGSSFGGKNRKPAPKYASSERGSTDEAGAVDKSSSSMFGIPRLHHSVSKRTNRPSTPNGTVSSKHSPKMRDSSAPVPVSKETKEMKEKDLRDPSVLRKRTTSAPPPPTVASPVATNGDAGPLKQGQSVLAQLGEPDHSGWMRKRGERYNNWKLRYFILKGHYLYWMKSSSTSETKVKGYLSIVGYKVTVDENVNPGKYGFRIEHDHEKTHYFSSDEKVIVRDWMKAIMKATIDRDYTKPVISSCNIPTIPLMVAQAMNPAPRPPSPGARDATQKALRRENPNQLSSRDARVLMGLSSPGDGKEDRTRLESFFSVNVDPSDSPEEPPKSPVPPRPSREMRRSIGRSSFTVSSEERALIEWANSHLPSSLQITDPTSSLCSGLGLLRMAESIKGRPLSPPVPDSAFPVNAADDKLDGLFRLFDFLLDNDVRMGNVSINDIRQAKRDKIVQLIKALKAWEDKRKALSASIGGASSVSAGAFIAPSGGYISPNWS